ncbi:MAG TPA: PQQ-binding-like beta-propeller repeat protein [Cyclobacteriaceae bacterium]|nr:PQQ-binding-like beta-propeller repeat protein [Cyclobacteriaceae bacterium]
MITQPKVFRALLLVVFICSFSLAFSQKPVDIEKQPTVQWKFKTRAPIFSTPVVSEGVAFFGGFDSTVYALDIQTGTRKWKLKTNGEIRSNLVLHNNNLYLAGGNGVLSCIDKNSGKRLWSVLFDNTALYLAERRYDFADYYHSSPLIYNNVIYLGASNGLMQAFKSENGELLWSFRANDIIHNNAVVVKDKLCFGSYDGNVYALNVRDGSLAWKFKSVGDMSFPKGEFNSSPAVSGNTLFIGSRDYHTYAINVNSGTGMWSKVFRAWAPAYTVRDTVVYVGTSDDRLLAAYDTRNGRELWKTDVKFNIFGNCAVSPNLVYVGTVWGRLLAVDAKTGAIKWAFNTDGFTANHDKYFKADDNYREDIGRILKSPVEWVGAEYKMGGIWSTPVLYGDRMIVTSSEGTVYCLK